MHDLHNNLRPERMKTDKVEKIVAKLNDKIDYVTYMRNLNEILNHG